MAPASSTASDPRTIITPDAFSVSDDLVGTPLASPIRRLLAIGIDLIFVGLFSLLGWYLLGIAVVFGAFRLAFFRKGDAGDQVFKAFKVILGCFGTFILFAVIVSGVAVYMASRSNLTDLARVAEQAGQLVNDGAEEPAEGSGPEEAPAPSPPAEGEGGAPLDLSSLGIAGTLQGIGEFALLSDADDPDEAEALVASVSARMVEAGMPAGDIRDVIAEVGPSGEPWWSEAMARGLSRGLGDVPPRGPEGTPDGTAAPVTQGIPLQEAVALYGRWLDDPTSLDSAQLDQVTRALASAVTSDSVQRLLAELEDSRDQATRLETQLENTQAELSAAEDRGIFSMVMDFADGAGLLFGWGTVYLTIFTAWWNGRTVGKRLLGIQVVRLNGQPMTGWLAFERAGGYAAGFATGLLGFAQVYWDPNRMAIHDKIAETVVIREGQAKIPGPWNLRPSGPRGTAGQG